MKNLFIKLYNQSTIADYIRKKLIFISKKSPIFLISLVYLISLLVINSNLSLLLVTLIYSYFIHQKTKNVFSTLFLIFLITLPFAKGKSLELNLIPKEQVLINPLFDINYYFSIYLSDIFLFLLIWSILRNNKKYKNLIKIKINKPELYLAGFIGYTLIASLFSLRPIVSFLSTLQLIKLFLIFLLPKIILEKKLSTKNILEIITASLIFQNLLVIFQYLNKGPLAIYLESFLPNSEFGIRAFENSDLIRLSGSFFEPSILGTYLLMQTTLSYFLQKKIKSSFLKKISWLSIIFTIPGVILTGSRAIYLIALIIIFSVITLEKINKTKQSILITKKIKELVNFKNLSVYILGSLIILFLPYLFIRLSSLKNIFDQYGSGTYRIQIAKQAFNLANEHVLGVGLDLSPYAFATKKLPKNTIFDPAHPHNIFFQILAETGFVGLVLFGSFIFFSVKQALYSKNNKQQPFIYGALVFLIAAQIYPIFINHIEILSFLFLYLGISNAKLDK